MACGAAPSTPTNLTAQAVTCAVWSSSATYVQGDTVTASGKAYRANFWTQGDSPASRNGPASSGQPWTLISSCGSTTPPPTTPPPTTPPPATCSATTWTRGVNYTLGTVVRYPGNGQYYKLVNVGSNGSDGTDPTISTWYWQPTTCSTTPPPSSGGFVVSEALFNQMFPNRNSFYTYAGLTTAMQAYPAFANTGSDTVRKQEAAAFLANVNQETGALVYIREINQANWNSYCSSGNCGGKQYYGRGPMQLSWDYNYRTAGAALGIDLLNNPDLVATDSAVAWKTALWYWMTQRAQAARTPHDAMVSGAGFGETIRAINGGIECNGGPGREGMLNRGRYYTDFAGRLGVPTGNNLTC
nr:glycoside hydrolase family 19 protein [Deinococcus arboris]